VEIYANTVGIYANTVGIYANTVGIYANTVGIYANTIEIYAKTFEKASPPRLPSLEPSVVSLGTDRWRASAKGQVASL
jgi:hypothetical protein